MDNLQQIQDDEYSFPYHYVTQFKNGFTAAYFDSWGINYGSTIEFILSKIGSENFRSVIDIGCGDGRLTQELQERFSSRKVLGIDYSKRAIQLAKSMSPHTEYRQIDITTEALGEQFDLGILMEVFEHVNPEVAAQFVEAVANCLHDKGILFVTVPHSNKALEYKHYRHFSSETLIACFASHFSVAEIIPFEKGKKRKRLIDLLLGNQCFILNSGRLKRRIYNYYKNHLFYADEKDCNRICVKFTKK